MRTPAAAELLSIWERSVGRTSIEVSMDLLYACSDTEDPAALSIGERDSKLFRLRERIFGPELFNVVDCPRCYERMEWISDVNDLLVVDQEKEFPKAAMYSLDVNDYHIQFRLPNSHDMLKAFMDPNYQSSSRTMYSDYIIQIEKGKENCNVTDLPEEVFDALDQRMAEQDPQADISILLNCPNCSHSWEMPFDIASYLWIEIDTWAKHILHEVTMLASTFGWSESDILNMNPRRRQYYLEMIR